EHTSISHSLLARLHANDPDAWQRLVTLYAPLVWHWCRRMDLPSQDIADVFQDVFKAVATHIQDFHKDRPTDTFRGWLRTITKNKVRDHFRLARREPIATGGTDAQVRWAQIPENSWDDEEPEANKCYHQLFGRALDLIQTEFEERSWQA